jgi:hypothetical protein
MHAAVRSSAYPEHSLMYTDVGIAVEVVCIVILLCIIVYIILQI